MFHFSEEALDQIVVAVQEGAEDEAFLAVGSGALAQGSHRGAEGRRGARAPRVFSIVTSRRRESRGIQASRPPLEPRRMVVAKDAHPSVSSSARTPSDPLR